MGHPIGQQCVPSPLNAPTLSRIPYTCTKPDFLFLPSREEGEISDTAEDDCASTTYEPESGEIVEGAASKPDFYGQWPSIADHLVLPEDRVPISLSAHMRNVKDKVNCLEVPALRCPFCDPDVYKDMRNQNHHTLSERVATVEQMIGDADTSMMAFKPEFNTIPFRSLLTGVPPVLSKKKTHHSKSMQAIRQRKRDARMVELLKTVEKNTEQHMHTGKSHLLFKKRPRSQEAGRTRVKVASYLSEAADLKPCPLEGNLFIKADPEFPIQPDDLEFLVMRFDNIISHETQQELIQAADNLLSSGPTFNSKESHRDNNPALHLGLWQKFVNKPFITKDTRQKNPSPLVAIHQLLTTLGEKVVPRLWRLMNRYDPKNLKLQEKASEYVRSHKELMNNLQTESPCADFGGLFFTVAVKEGGSQKMHIDWDDHPLTYAWIITVGDEWTGGELCLPQLGIKVPTKSGQVIAFRARYLSHFATPSSNGRRFVFTGFTNYSLMKNALTPTPTLASAKKSTSSRSKAPRKKRKSNSKKSVFLSP